ncbi:hypothetical protein BHE74_00059558 [Ensete ventricosum]|nr:hypothetical protein BHE74_00059558 [Ensete ventricosum]RZS27792.1 hypothetical protein BHM03_00061319 [Ensete ventricosum]
MWLAEEEEGSNGVRLGVAVHGRGLGYSSDSDAPEIKKRHRHPVSSGLGKVGSWRLMGHRQCSWVAESSDDSGGMKGYHEARDAAAKEEALAAEEGTASSVAASSRRLEMLLNLRF